MNTPALPLDRDAMRLVAEIGFIAIDSNQLAQARVIFESLLVLRPDSNLPYIGLGTTELGSGRPEDAARILGDGLKQVPGDTEIMTFLGLALEQAGRKPEARKMLTDAIAQASAPGEAHVRMAQKLLDRMGASSSPASLMPRWSEQARQAAGIGAPTLDDDEDD